MRPAIEARGLSRRFGDVLAVDGVDFVVDGGEIFGFLGPNGAGKSTTVRMLTGYIAPTRGSVALGGFDLAKESTRARSLIGVVPEEANVYADLTVWQNVMLMAELHGIGRAQRHRRGSELLEQFGLGARHAQKGRELSKGLRQRLMLCMALVGDPAILFLDEPTSGLDVASARLIREVIGRLNRERGTTVFLTTHNIDEADALCHRVGVIHRGRIAAIDTPQRLRGTIQSRRSVEVRFVDSGVSLEQLMQGESVGEVVELPDGFRFYTQDPGALAQRIATRASEESLRIDAITTLAPSLEDVFLSLTQGRVPEAGGHS
jgi:ABC-2 type transport system ATP-binding protein